MVRYLDPEEHPELGEERQQRSSPAQRLARMRERNAALEGQDAIEAAREVALRKLDARSCSRAELTDAITSRGFSSDTATEVVERLERVGLVNDQAYADALVRDRFSLSGKSGRALRMELERKKIPADIINRALSSIDRDDEKERARELVEKKMRSLRGTPREVCYRRLTSMLARKGYPAGLATSIVVDALNTRDDVDQREEEEWQWGL